MLKENYDFLNQLFRENLTNQIMATIISMLTLFIKAKLQIIFQRCCTMEHSEFSLRYKILVEMPLQTNESLCK